VWLGEGEVLERRSTVERMWMRSSRVVSASDCILRHSGICGAEEEAVLNKVGGGGAVEGGVGRGRMQWEELDREGTKGI
jgi:hypothetical protein